MHRSVTCSLLLLCLLCSPACLVAQRTGGGDLNPGLYTNQKAINRFQDLKIGLSIHWGPSSLSGEEISWARGEQVSKAKYDSLYLQFNPTRFNADEWVKLMQDAGMRYVLITSKHHDGFALWHSAVTDYDMAATPFRRDICRELADACRRQNIVFGTYYSTLDWYHPDYLPHGHGGPGPLYPTAADTPNPSRYWAFMRAQLKELVNDYGSEIIQFDGDWDSTWTHAIGSETYRYLRTLKDDVLISSRTDKTRYPPDGKRGLWRPHIFAGDYEERERFTENFGKSSDVSGRAAHAWQAWVTLDKSQWSWKPNPKPLSASEVIVDLAKTIGDGGNYLINVGPRPDGSFEPAQVSTLQEVGRWVRTQEKAIYGTRLGPWSEPNVFTTTRRGKDVYVFVLDASKTSLTLPAPVRQATNLDGKRLAVLGKTVQLPAGSGVRVFVVRE